MGDQILVENGSIEDYSAELQSESAELSTDGLSSEDTVSNIAANDNAHNAFQDRQTINTFIKSMVWCDSNNMLMVEDSFGKMEMDTQAFYNNILGNGLTGATS